MFLKKWLCVLSVAAGVGAAPVQLITNGDFENDSTEWNFKVQGSAAGTRSIELSDRSNAGKCAVATVTTTGSDYFQAQLVQVGFPMKSTTSYTISFWAKADAVKSLQLALQETLGYKGTYKTVNLSSSWQYFEYTGQTRPQSHDTVKIQLAFSVGKFTGKFYIDDVKIVDENKTVTVIPDDWYSKADERIAANRKGDFIVSIKKNGVAVPSCSVKVDLKKGEFLWGTCLRLTTATDDNEKKYRDTAAKYFNYGVFENAFKWSEVERTQNTPNYTEVNRHLAWTDSMGWDMRGHTLVWGRTKDNHGMPSWAQQLRGNDLIAACSTRVVREMTKYKGKLKEYDVVNEPLHERWLDSTLGGDKSIYSKIFKWAKATDPTAELYINEFNILEWTEKDAYLSVVDKIIKAGGPIDGIGIQGHLTQQFTWKSIAQNIQTVADYGLPIKITENDINMNGASDDSLAKMYSTVMRVAFSHPSVKSFVFWGFWEQRHWRPAAALFKSDWTKRPAADSVYNLIHNVWSTHLATTTNNSGVVAFNGFNGTYTFSVKDGNEWKTITSPVVLSGKGNKTLSIDIGTMTVGVNGISPRTVSSSVIAGTYNDNIVVYGSNGRVAAKLNKTSGAYLTITRGGSANLTGTHLSNGTYFAKTIHNGKSIMLPVVIVK